MEIDNHFKSHGVSEDEISLAEIWQILTTRKWLVLAAPVITVLLAVTYLALTKPLFESTAHVLIGQVARGQLVKNPAVLVTELKEKYRVDDKSISQVYPRLYSVSFDKKDSSSILLLKTEGHTPQGVKAYLTEITEEVLMEQKRLFEQGIQLKQAHLQALTDQVENFEAYQIQLDKRIEDIAKKDPTQAAILAVEKGKFLATMPDLENQRFELQNSMREYESYPAKLISEPRLPEKPFKPKRALVLLSAAFLGLIFGIVAAFFAEYVVKIKQ